MKRQWCLSTIDARFIAQLEQILWLYAQPHDPAYPVICFDERPCFLMGDVLDPVPLQTGQVAKEQYAYTKHGSCALLAAIEPLTGRRLAYIQPQRTMLEYTHFCQALVAHWPDATRIRLVQDNLNTHSPTSFYHHLPADLAFALAQKFEFVYTPKAASWLNMIEIEFSALARACLHWRIPTIHRLRSEVLALVHERDRNRIPIPWQFSIPDARHTFNSHYSKLFPSYSAFPFS